MHNFNGIECLGRVNRIAVCKSQISQFFSFNELERTAFFVFLLKKLNFLCSLGDVTGEACGEALGEPHLFCSGLLSLPVCVRESERSVYARRE